MPYGLIITGQILYTILSLLVIILWLWNVIKYFGQIKTSLPNIIFYLYALASIITSFLLAWTSVCDFGTYHWQARNYTLRYCEACLTLSLSLAFFLVARNLSEVKEMPNANFTPFTVHKYTSTGSCVFVVGIAI